MVTIAAEDIVHGGLLPTIGWPGYSDLFSIEQPTDILRGPIFHTGSPKYGWVHGEPFEPLAEAPKAAGARCVELEDSRMLGADF